MGLVLLIANISNAKITGNNFSGEWCWDNDSKVSAFGIGIRKVSNIYKGNYGSVTQSGGKIDENEKAFSFKAPKINIVKTQLISGITGNVGMVQLSILNNKKIEWLVLKKPKGEFYPPLKALLHRC